MNITEQVKFNKVNDKEVEIVINGADSRVLDGVSLEILVDILRTKINKDTRIFLNGDILASNPIFIGDKIIKRLDEKYPNSYKEFLIESFGLDCTKNIESYNKICQKYGIKKHKLIFTNLLEAIVGNPAVNETEFYRSNFSTEPRIKPKKFLCFNHNPRIHRMYFISKIIENNLLDKAHVSFLLRGDQKNKSDIISAAYSGEMNYVIPKFKEQVKDVLMKNIDLFPIELNWFTESDFYNYTGTVVNDIKYYNETYFSFVTESVFFKEFSHIIENQFDCASITEKTWKPILARHPFIMTARPNTLAALREAGYKTFHPFIDESYDYVQDDHLRLETIFSEVLRLCSFTDEQWLEWQHNVKDILEHNFEHAIKRYHTSYIRNRNYKPNQLR